MEKVDGQKIEKKEQEIERESYEKKIFDELLIFAENLKENNLSLYFYSDDKKSPLYSLEGRGDAFVLKNDNEEISIEAMNLAKSLVWAKKEVLDKFSKKMIIEGDLNSKTRQNLSCLRSLIQHKLILEDGENTFDVYEDTAPMADFEKNDIDKELRSYFINKVRELKTKPESERKEFNLRQEVLKDYISDNRENIKKQFEIIDLAIKKIDQEALYDAPEENYNEVLDYLKDGLEIDKYLTQFQKRKFEKGFFYAYFAQKKIDQIISQDPQEVLKNYMEQKKGLKYNYQFQGRVEIEKVGFTLGIYFYSEHDYKHFWGEKYGKTSGGKADSINGIPIVYVNIREDATDLAYVRGTKEHEWRHIRDNFLIPEKEQYERTGSYMKTEILAYIKDGRSLKEIYNILTDPDGLYTYGKSGREREDYYEQVRDLLNSISKLNKVNLDVLAIYPVEMWQDLCQFEIMNELIEISRNSTEIVEIKKDGWFEFYQSFVSKEIIEEKDEDLSVLEKFGDKNFSTPEKLNEFIEFLLLTEEDNQHSIKTKTASLLVSEEFGKYLENTKEFIFTLDSDKKTIDFLINEAEIFFSLTSLIEYSLNSDEQKSIREKFTNYIEIRAGDKADEIKGDEFERVESFYKYLMAYKERGEKAVENILAEIDAYSKKEEEITKELENKFKKGEEINYQDVIKMLPIYRYDREANFFSNIERVVLGVLEKYLELKPIKHKEDMESKNQRYLLQELQSTQSFLKDLYDLGRKRDYYEQEEKNRYENFSPELLGNFVKKYIDSRFDYEVSVELNEGRDIWEKFYLAEKFVRGESNLSDKDQDSLAFWDSYREFHEHNQYKNKIMNQFEEIDLKYPEKYLAEMIKLFNQAKRETYFQSSFDIAHDLLLRYLQKIDFQFKEKDLDVKSAKALEGEIQFLWELYSWILDNTDESDKENYLSRLDFLVNKYIKSRYYDYLYKFKGNAKYIKMVRVIDKLSIIKKMLEGEK